MAFKGSSLFINSFKAPKWLNTNVFGNKVDDPSFAYVWPSLTDLTNRQYSDSQLSVLYADGLFPAYIGSVDSQILEDMYHWKRFRPPDFVTHGLFNRTKLVPKMFWKTNATYLQIESTACFSYQCCFLSWIDNMKRLFIVDQFQHSKNVKSDLNQICTTSDQIQNESHVSFSFSLLDLNSFSLEITKAERINDMFLECIVSNKPCVIHEQYDNRLLKENNDNNKASFLNMDMFNLNSLRMLCPVQGMCLFFNTCAAFSQPHGQ